jgi:Double zinc ribbon
MARRLLMRHAVTSSPPSAARRARKPQPQPLATTTPGQCACGQPADATAKFCIACGASLAAVCLPCGQRNPVDARFCNACGVLLAIAGRGD